MENTQTQKLIWLDLRSISRIAFTLKVIAISPCNLWLKAVKVFICHSFVAILYGLQMVTLPWVVFSRKYQICPNGFGSIREGCHAALVEDGMMPLASKDGMMPPSTREGDVTRFPRSRGTLLQL